MAPTRRTAAFVLSPWRCALLTLAALTALLQVPLLWKLRSPQQANEATRSDALLQQLEAALRQNRELRDQVEANNKMVDGLRNMLLATESQGLRAGGSSDDLRDSLVTMQSVVASVRSKLGQLKTQAQEQPPVLRGDTGATVHLQPQAGGPLAESLQRCTDPADDVEHEFAIFITTANRVNAPLYLKDELDSLRKAGVAAKAITVFNVDRPGVHAKLEEWMETEDFARYPVRVISRDRLYPTPQEYLDESDPAKRKQMMQDFPFSIRPVEVNHHYFKEAMGDEPRRVYWRTKESADFVFAARSALYHYRAAKWLIFLEDDMLFTRRTGKLADLIKQARDESTGVTWLNPAVSKAVLMQRQYLESFTGYAALRYDFYPIDWLIDTFEDSLDTSTRRKRRVVSMFKHIGHVRSLNLRP